MRDITCDVPAARGQVRHSLFVSWRVTPPTVCASFIVIIRGFCTFFCFYFRQKKSVEREIFYIKNESRRFFSSEQLDPSARDQLGNLLSSVPFFIIFLILKHDLIKWTEVCVRRGRRSAAVCGTTRWIHPDDCACFYLSCVGSGRG